MELSFPVLDETDGSTVVSTSAPAVEEVVWITSTSVTVGDCVSMTSGAVGDSVASIREGEGAAVSIVSITGDGVGGGASTAGQNAAFAGA
jgi:hypothetical protein